MEEIKCKICGKIFSYPKLSSCRAQMSLHLKNDHNITLEEYIVQYELNGEHPKCLCGCGENVTFNKHNWTWHKYAKDSHVGKAFNKEAERIKKEFINARKITFDVKEYYKQKYDSKVANQSAQEFLSKEFTLTELSNKYNLDKRTLKKMWIEMGLINGETIANIAQYHHIHSIYHKKNDKDIDESIYTWCYSLVKEYPQKYNIYSILNEFKKNNKIELEIHPQSFYHRLKRIYGDEIDILLQKGYHSKEENDFFYILQFFFGKEHNIKLGFQISKERYSPIYDICIDGKFIIEYDSYGQYHRTNEAKERDEKKEKIAIEKGYKIIHLTYDDMTNFNTLKKIEEWLNL